MLEANPPDDKTKIIVPPSTVKATTAKNQLRENGIKLVTDAGVILIVISTRSDRQLRQKPSQNAKNVRDFSVAKVRYLPKVLVRAATAHAFHKRRAKFGAVKCFD